jgi:CubicO group peptidase (beta-lactamase class C family)
MSKLNEVSDWLRDRLPALLAEHGVPGAAIAVSVDGEIVEHAAGVLSTATGVTATTDSLFQIGSITKVWTTTLVMQLVDEGVLDLDAPIRRYLPDFRVADEAASAAITTRQLLCHTAGFEGDLFTDTGKGDDCVEKYVATLADTAQLFPAGEMFSYNNAGFCVLGRIVEVLRGKCYDDCLRQYLFAPLGLRHAAADPYEAILHRAAVGHIKMSPEAELAPAPVWALVRSNGPAGAMLCMSPRDLLTFAHLHLAGGETADGTRVLSADSVAAMRKPQVTVPDVGLMGTAWGLGWELFEWSGQPIIGHDGGTIGQSAFLRVVPERGVAIALLTNGGNPLALYTEMYTHLLRELADVQMPAMRTPSADPQPVDARRYAGTYASEVGELTVVGDDEGRLWLEEKPLGILAEMGAAPERSQLAPFGGDTFVQVEPKMGIHLSHVFVGDDGSGRALYIHSGRATRRVAD